MPATTPAPPPPPRSKVKRKAPKPPVQQPLADDPYGQGIPGANPYGFTSYDPDQAAPYEDAFDEQPVGGSGFAAVNAARQAPIRAAFGKPDVPAAELVDRFISDLGMPRSLASRKAKNPWTSSFRASSPNCSFAAAGSRRWRIQLR